MLSVIPGPPANWGGSAPQNPRGALEPKGRPPAGGLRGPGGPGGPRAQGPRALGPMPKLTEKSAQNRTPEVWVDIGSRGRRTPLPATFSASTGTHDSQFQNRDRPRTQNFAADHASYLPGSFPGLFFFAFFQGYVQKFRKCAKIWVLVERTSPRSSRLVPARAGRAPGGPRGPPGGPRGPPWGP